MDSGGGDLSWIPLVLVLLVVGVAFVAAIANEEQIVAWWRERQVRAEEREERQVALLLAQPLLVRTYRSERAYQADAVALAGYGFRVANITVRQQSNGCLYLVLILLFWLIIPIILLLILIIVSPPGSYFVVTYEQTRMVRQGVRDVRQQ